MATRVIISAMAGADLLEILDYISPQNLDRALSFVQEIQERASRTLATLPDGGAPYKGSLRYLTISGYVFVYEHLKAANEVHILSVHGRGEDWKG
jgi:plasmid stabilization system protein ParE